MFTKFDCNQFVRLSTFAGGSQRDKFPGRDDFNVIYGKYVVWCVLAKVLKQKSRDASLLSFSAHSEERQTPRDRFSWTNFCIYVLAYTYYVALAHLLKTHQLLYAINRMHTRKTCAVGPIRVTTTQRRRRRLHYDTTRCCCWWRRRRFSVCVWLGWRWLDVVARVCLLPFVGGYIVHGWMGVDSAENAMWYVVRVLCNSEICAGWKYCAFCVQHVRGAAECYSLYLMLIKRIW